MHDINTRIERVGAADAGAADLQALLDLSTPAEIAALHAAAYQVKLAHVGGICHFRGIVEFSNICSKDCLYCGIRRSNTDVKRFTMEAQEILDAAKWAYEAEYGSMVLQSGERQDDNFVDFVEHLLQEIRTLSHGKLGITLSLGEQTPATYHRWFDAGAHRYLLRIETSNASLYQQLHPGDHDFQTRHNCLLNLRDIGYQVGTGVMIGLPGQTTADLANDILYFRDLDVDMIGMGPYIPHDDTPMGAQSENFDGEAQLELGLKMISTVRLFLSDINIAATTALQALNPTGRELGLKAGANIIMPNVTDTKYREAYQLYDNKPCLDENSTMCRGCLSRRVTSIGETIGFNHWGDSPHFFARTGQSKA